MSRQRTTPANPYSLAVFHRTGASWRVVLADIEGSRPEIKDARQFNAAEHGRIERWLDEHAPGEVLCVLPSGTTVCRTCHLPDLPAEELAQALQLQAEAHVADLAPPHRIAVAALDVAPGETGHDGIMIAWPPGASFQAPVARDDVRFAPDIAGLAALMDGERPSDPLLWLDRAEGSISLALTHPNGAALRAVRESADHDHTWQQTVMRVIAETALNVKHTSSFVQELVDCTNQRLSKHNDDESLLILPTGIIDSAVQRLRGAPTDESWWSSYGIATGVVLARTGNLSPLTELIADVPDERPSIIDRTVSALSQPRRAVLAVVACLLVFALGPLVTNFLRVKAIELRYGDLDARLEQVREIRYKADMYDELKGEMWPMTKLIADITANTPPGFELQYIRIEQDQMISAGGRIVPWKGTPALQVIEQMQKNFNASGIFTEFDFETGQANSWGHYENVSVTAKVLDPFRQPQYDIAQDFAQWTMQQRVDDLEPGERLPWETGDDQPARVAGADATATTPTRTMPRDTTPRGEATPSGADGAVPLDRSPLAGGERPPRVINRGGGSGDDGARGVDERDVARLPASQDIPDPLTPEQIKAMTLEEAKAALARVGAARPHVRDDEELSERLRTEFNLLLERMRELN